MWMHFTLLLYCSTSQCDQNLMDSSRYILYGVHPMHTVLMNLLLEDYISIDQLSVFLFGVVWRWRASSSLMPCFCLREWINITFRFLLLPMQKYCGALVMQSLSIFFAVARFCCCCCCYCCYWYFLSIIGLVFIVLL